MPTISPRLNTLAAQYAAEPQLPEFTKLPLKGGDAICGLSRSQWYDFERQGRIRLVRLRNPGNVRAGKVLIPVRQAVALLMSMAEPPKDADVSRN